LIYFGKTIVTAQEYTQSLVNFMIKKAKFYDRAKDKLNPRQDKAIARMFEEGLRGFKGGLSAENYIRITDSSRATATRDLQDLVEKGLFTSTGELKGTRYNLKL
jgi:Fic family protein